MSEAAFHPAAGIFPLLDEAELEALAEDIGTYGLRQRPAEPMVPPVQPSVRELAMHAGVRFST